MIKKTSVILIIMFLTSMLYVQCFAHPGRTDASGGHTVRTAGWGYPVGSYHYHNGGGATAAATTKNDNNYSATPKKVAVKDTSIEDTAYLDSIVNFNVSFNGNQVDNKIILTTETVPIKLQLSHGKIPDNVKLNYYIWEDDKNQWTWFSRELNPTCEVWSNVGVSLKFTVTKNGITRYKITNIDFVHKTVNNVINNKTNSNNDSLTGYTPHTLLNAIVGIIIIVVVILVFILILIAILSVIF